MSDHERAPAQRDFVRGNDRIDQLLSDPQLAAEVAEATPAPRRWTGSTR